MVSSMIELASVCLAVWLVSILYRQWTLVRDIMRDIGDVPGKGIAWIRPDCMASMAAAPWFPRPGDTGHYFGKFSVFKKYGTTCLSSVSFWAPTPIYFVSDADAFRAINNERAFGKDVEKFEPLNVYGKNIISTIGSEWKRHRAVVRSAFNEANNAYVWTETCRIINQWFSTVDAKPEQPIDCLRVFTQIAFLVIASAGFGAKIDFNESLDLTSAPVIDKECTRDSAKPMYTFGSSLTTAVRGITVRSLTPTFVYPISKYIRIPFISRMVEETATSFGSLKIHMRNIISNARDELLSEHAEKYCESRTDSTKNNGAGAALLKNLAQSNGEEEFGGDRLTDDEIMSDTFVFLLAGHETTARLLCFMVCLLALHPETQAKVYAEACELWPEAPSLDTPPEYKGSLPHLEYATAVFYETMRLFSPVIRLTKTAFSDTILRTRRFTTNTDGSLDNVEMVNTPIKTGSVIVLDMNGLHYNPIHWGEDVDKFKPERFIDTETYKWPRDAFCAFSQGHRSCIGQRFAITEAACIIANLVRRYEILVPANLESKPKVEQEKELLQYALHLTITPTNAWVRLRKRVTERGA